MRSPHGFIVTPEEGSRYKTKRGEIIISTSKEDSKNSSRIAKVVEPPLGYKGPISSGDLLVVHHNVFKYYNDMKGLERSGKSFLSGNLFFVEPDQWFMYKKQGGEWTTHDKYCFVEPKPLNSFFMKVPGIDYHLVGQVAYSNDQLSELGVEKGDFVGFTPESEYEFEIDGVKLYRMFTNNICIKI
jgi:co-chaperonin GroES (HSP10)